MLWEALREQVIAWPGKDGDEWHLTRRSRRAASPKMLWAERGLTRQAVKGVGRGGEKSCMDLPRTKATCWLVRQGGLPLAGAAGPGKVA